MQFTASAVTREYGVLQVSFRTLDSNNTVRQSTENRVPFLKLTSLSTGTENEKYMQCIIETTEDMQGFSLTGNLYSSATFRSGVLQFRKLLLLLLRERLLAYFRNSTRIRYGFSEMKSTSKVLIISHGARKA